MPLAMPTDRTTGQQVIRANRKDTEMTATTAYTIPSATDASRSIVSAATEALTDPTVRVEDALGLATLPTDDGAKAVSDATEALKTAKANAQTYARLRFDGVALAYSTGRVGKGRMYSGQRDLAKALGMTQGRVSQILTAQATAERVGQVKRTLKDAAKQGGISDVEGLSSVIHAIATDSPDADTIAAHVEALTAGKVPTHVATVGEMDTDALLRLAERVLVLSGGVVSSATDRDALARVAAMLTTATNNVRSSAKVSA